MPSNCEFSSPITIYHSISVHTISAFKKEEEVEEEAAVAYPAAAYPAVAAAAAAAAAAVHLAALPAAVEEWACHGRRVCSSLLAVRVVAVVARPEEARAAVEAAVAGRQTDSIQTAVAGRQMGSIQTAVAAVAERQEQPSCRLPLRD